MLWWCHLQSRLWTQVDVPPRSFLRFFLSFSLTYNEVVKAKKEALVKMGKNLWDFSKENSAQKFRFEITHSRAIQASLSQLSEHFRRRRMKHNLASLLFYCIDAEQSFFFFFACEIWISACDCTNEREIIGDIDWISRADKLKLVLVATRKMKLREMKESPKVVVVR